MEFLGFALVIIGLGLLLTGLEFWPERHLPEKSFDTRLKTFVIVALNCGRAALRAGGS
jgi:hypothetical protein